MIVINKYTSEVNTIMVGMETTPSTMEWPDSVAMVTEQQLWLKEKLTDIEAVLIKLLKGDTLSITHCQVLDNYFCLL